MIAVADSSPLVILAKIGCFHLLNPLFARVYISAEVHHEVVLAGAGLPGSQEVTSADWIETKGLANPAQLQEAISRYPLGAGELSSILLAEELSADAVLLDDHKARTLARTKGLPVRGSVGLLEIFHVRGLLPDLRAAFRLLLAHNVYIDTKAVEPSTTIFTTSSPLISSNPFSNSRTNPFTSTSSPSTPA